MKLISDLIAVVYGLTLMDLMHVVFPWWDQFIVIGLGS